MSRVIHFDLRADSPLRAAEFDRRVFNWNVNKWEGPEDYCLIKTGTEQEPGVTGGVAGRIKPEDTTAVIVDVESVDEAEKKVVEADGNTREEKGGPRCWLPSDASRYRRQHLRDYANR